MKLSLLVLAIIIVLTGCNNANEYAKTKTVSKLDSLFNQLEQDGLFNGDMLLSANGDVIFHKSFGYKDFESKTSFAQNSLFEIASITKPFTALAIAKLVSDSKIGYSDLVKTYIPELPYESITIEQLINHTSGLPDYAQVLYPNWDYNKIADNNDLMQIMIEKKPKLLSRPGKEWKYSNIGYVMLTIIIERVSGKSYPEYVQEEIFNPLGMVNTIIPDYNEALKLDSYVDDYVYNFGNDKYLDPKNFPSFDNGTFTANMYGASGICTNAIDLLKFTDIFKSQTIVSDSIFNSYLKPQNIKTPMSDDFTKGWFYSRDSILGPSYFFVGGFAGYRSLVQYFSKSQTTIVILSNIYTTPVWDIKRMVNEILANKGIKYPKKSFVRKISKSIRQNNYDIKAFEENFICDTSQYKLREYELNELLDDYKSAKKDSLNLVVLKKILECYPNDASIINRLEELTNVQQ